MNDERKPRLHVNIGGLIILIIIVVLLFKVDIKSKIESEQFKKNIAYVENQAKDLWQKYVVSTVKSKTGEIFMEATNEGIKKMQTGFTDNLLKTNNIEKNTE